MNSDTEDAACFAPSTKYVVGQVDDVKMVGFCCRMFINSVEPDLGRPIA